MQSAKLSVLTRGAAHLSTVDSCAYDEVLERLPSAHKIEQDMSGSGRVVPTEDRAYESDVAISLRRDT